MKIAISANDSSLESTLDMRFGRAPSFLIYELEQQTYKSIDNTQNLSSAQGAGIQSAQNLVNADVKVLITGNVGPKAFQVLKTAGVDIYLTPQTTIQEAIDNFKAGKLTKSETNNVEGHWV
ncbi:MAG: dinitrogenase iron-molybdenum cofactor biosynthesis protein [Peptococcaceae bacterium BICA1-8]|nr:MAG: dinitrogenase iron-molybdenum cofactor biosynthesis protein [Peptococcaceae bacterium BICA1-8]